MAAFEYKALDAAGKQKKGVLEADSARQIRQQLREKGWMPLAVEPTVQKQERASVGRQRVGRGLKVIELALITRQLATLVQAALPVEEALKAIADQNEKNKIKGMILAIRAKVLEGHGLAASMSEFPKAFPELYRSTVAAGEHAGHLELVLNRLADYTESRQLAKSKIQMALLYPIILTVVALGVVVLLLTFVVPDIIEVFDDTGKELPPITIGLIATSDFLVNYWLYLLIGISSAIFLFISSLKNQAFRFALHKQILTLPLIGRLARSSNTARFASTVSMLHSSGVPLVEGLKIAAQVTSNLCVRASLEKAAQKVSEGTNLRLALEQTRYFPPMMLQMIASGESSGELGSMLSRAADTQERELDTFTSTLVGLFEPFMLLFMGGVVFLIVLAIILPIININDIVG